MNAMNAMKATTYLYSSDTRKPETAKMNATEVEDLKIGACTAKPQFRQIEICGSHCFAIHFRRAI
jgi:hypothetical protein